MAASRASRRAKSAKPRRRKPAQLGPAEVRLLFERLRAANPSPRTELAYASPYQLLVSVILSAQATDKSVNLATGPLFRAAPTPAAIAALGEAGLADYIRTHRPVAHEGEERDGRDAHDPRAARRRSPA